MIRLSLQLLPFIFGTAICAANISTKDSVTIRSTAQLKAAISSSALNGKLLYVISPLKITENMVVPSDITLNIKTNGFITVSTGKKLTILGKLSCSNSQCFDDKSDISLASDSVPVIYPEWFGAHGEGRHDDTSALNAAIKASPAGQVLKGRGTYSVTQINVNKELHLADLNLVARNSTEPIEKQDVLNITASNVIVERCNITSSLNNLTNVKNASCLYANKVSGLKVKGCVFDGGKNLTVSTVEYGSVAIHNSDNIIVENTKILNAQYEGILLVSCTHALVSDVYAHNCGNSGIGTQYGSENTIRKSVVDNCGASNITMNSSESSVEDCLSKNAGTWGINLGHLHIPANNSKCVRNTVQGAGRLSSGNWGGIQMQSSSNVTISDNVIKPSVNYLSQTPPRYNSGIVVGNKPVSCKITNNVISSQPGYGIRVFDNNSQTDIQIDSNAISGSYFTGIYVHGGNSVIIRNNKIVDSNRSGSANHSGVWVDGGNGKTRMVYAVDNVIDDGRATKENYGILINNLTESSDVLIANNSINGWTRKSLLVPRWARVERNSI